MPTDPQRPTSTSRTSPHRVIFPVFIVPAALFAVGPHNAAGLAVALFAGLFFAWATDLPTTVEIDETHVTFRVGILTHLGLLPTRFRRQARVPLKKIDWIDLHKGVGNDWTVQINVADGAFKKYLFVADGDRLGMTFRERGVFVREETPGDGTGARGKPAELN